MLVIIDWLMTDGNYTHWRDSDKHNGTSKAGITNELSQLIKDKCIIVDQCKIELAAHHFLPCLQSETCRCWMRMAKQVSQMTISLVLEIYQQ